MIDINNIPLDDKKTYELLSRGKTNGIFQLESSGMKSLCKRLKPTEFKHIDAIVALFRPGAMQFMDEYIENKANPENIKYIDSRLEDVLKDTYGIIVYQEQVMKVAQVLAGYSLGEADSLRRAIGKKDIKEMKANKERFISGCINNGVEQKIAEELYSQIEVFARYSFNRCIDGDYVFPEFEKSLNELYNNGYRNLKLKSYNTETQCFFEDDVVEILSSGENHVFEILLDNNKKISCTKNHKFLCKDNKYYTVSEIIKNDLEIIGE